MSVAVAVYESISESDVTPSLVAMLELKASVT